MEPESSTVFDSSLTQAQLYWEHGETAFEHPNLHWTTWEALLNLRSTKNGHGCLEVQAWHFRAVRALLINPVTALWTLENPRSVPEVLTGLFRNGVGWNPSLLCPPGIDKPPWGDREAWDSTKYRAWGVGCFQDQLTYLAQVSSLGWLSGKLVFSVMRSILELCASYENVGPQTRRELAEATKTGGSVAHRLHQAARGAWSMSGEMPVYLEMLAEMPIHVNGPLLTDRMNRLFCNFVMDCRIAQGEVPRNERDTETRRLLRQVEIHQVYEAIRHALPDEYPELRRRFPYQPYFL